MKIVIEYDALSHDLSVPYNDFTHIEAMGVLQAALAAIQNDWITGTTFTPIDD